MYLNVGQVPDLPNQVFLGPLSCPSAASPHQNPPVLLNMPVRIMPPPPPAPIYISVTNWTREQELKKERARTRTRHARAKVAVPDAVSFAREMLGFLPDAMQEALLRCDAKQVILNCCRQWGKSTIVAIIAVYRAYSVPKSVVVVVSPTERQSAEFLLKAREFAIKLGLTPRGDGHNRTSLRLPNGSRIVGLPGKEANIRGFSADLLIIDEAARVPDELYKSVRPMLAVKDGDVWLLSTPWGKQGFFHENWEFGGDSWARFRVPATECSAFRPSGWRWNGRKWARRGSGRSTCVSLG